MSYFEDNFTMEDVCAPVHEPTKRQNTITELRKSLKNNYCSVKLPFKKKWKGQYLKTIQFSYYKASTNSGSPIIHAITGDYLPGSVGSLSENRYYKVKVACFDKERNGTLFYLSQDEYENHQYCIPPEEEQHD